MHLLAHHLEELIELDGVVGLVLADLLHHQEELYHVRSLPQRLHYLLQLIEGQHPVLVLRWISRIYKVLAWRHQLVDNV